MVRRFAEQGCAVVFSGRSVDLGKSIEVERTAKGQRATFTKADLTNSDEVRATIELAVEKYGKLTNLVNVAAGTDTSGALPQVLDLTPEQWLEYLNKGLIGGMVTPVKYAVPHMAKAGGGSVVTIGASSGSRGMSSPSPYAAAKGAEIALSVHWAYEFAHLKIRFNIVAPGFVDTDTAYIRALKATPELISIYEKAHLLGLGEPDDLAYAALWLASDESKWVTGQLIPVEGGLTTFVGMRDLEKPEIKALKAKVLKEALSK
jgi:NAD(P)-dependent dehydrogenase (short-subunit alcohol dehydrogenase family)